LPFPSIGRRRWPGGNFLGGHDRRDGSGDPDAGSPIVIEQRKVSGLADTLTLPPCSVTLWVLDVK